MSLNVNYNSLYKNGIDTSVLKEVSGEILRRAAEKNSQYTNSATTQRINSVPKAADLGIDLYQGKVNTTVQNQIATNNSIQFQFNQETLNSIQFLNTQAAIAKVDGKYTPAVNNTVTETQKAVETNNASQFMSIFAAETATDKDGSNPFYYGGAKPSKESDDKNLNETDSLKSIFS